MTMMLLGKGEHASVVPHAVRRFHALLLCSSPCSSQKA
jgi:hypothetical protein